ncbi:MAG TPA: HAD family phosphatase [Aggregatilineales bacterium]|nr:HAD family phosphatase [Aggregatilineales bacterium]
MIEAIIFDLDGTLVQTERLKAISYAQAAVELCPDEISEEAVIEAFKDVVGLPRREVAQALVERFGLESAASLRMEEFGVATPWQAYVQVRLQIYDKMLSDPAVIRDHQWAHNIELLNMAHRLGCKTGLATMSGRDHVQRVLQALDVADHFQFTACRDDVEHGKPDPEIYLLVAHELKVNPPDCLVIEDSPVGVDAALTAGMHVIAVTTPFTVERLYAANLLDVHWIVDHPDQLPMVVQQCFEQLK